MEGLAPLFVVDHATATVEREGLTFGLYLNRKPEGRRLLVSMSNMIARERGSLPSIVPLDWCEDDTFHVLSICDPTLYLDDEIEVSSFLGDCKRSPIPGVTLIAFEVAKRLGVESDDVVFWGVSGGGFGAMMAAIRCGGNAVAINAQSDLNHLRHWSVVKKQFQILGDGTVREQCASMPQRTSIAKAMSSHGAGARIIVVQNKTDAIHFGRHFPELTALPGVMGLTYSSPEAHAPATPETNRWILAEALAHLSQDRAQVA